MSLEVSLYTIESHLSNLIEMREQTLASLKLAESEGDLPQTIERLNEEAVEIEAAIQLYIKTEIAKVDNIRAFWRHCELMRDAAKAEAETQAQRAKAWGSRLDRLKEICRAVMETIPFPAGKPHKLEGRTGSLTLKANGGKQAVEITDESLVPDEFTRKTVTLSPLLWNDVLNELSDKMIKRLVAEAVESKRIVSLSLIGEALQKPCAACNGVGAPWNNSASVPCPECGGSGCAGVPGARLAERGQHVEVK